MSDYESEVVGIFSLQDYEELLNKFDSSVCNAIAVSQQSGNRYVDAYIGYSASIFTRICVHAQSLMRAVPMSRWVKSDFHNWDFSCIAPHVRAIMDGYLLFSYLSETPASEEQWKAKLWVMHLNDCTKRIKLMSGAGHQEQVDFYNEEKIRIQGILNENEYFSSIAPSIRKKCLNGSFLMIDSRDELLEKNGFDKVNFDITYDIFSHYVHVLPISYYRMEANGRGTGVFNATDLNYMSLGLSMAGEYVDKATQKMVSFFPDVDVFRRGIRSEFSPGPKSNLPQIIRERKNKNDKKKRKK